MKNNLLAEYCKFKHSYYHICIQPAQLFDEKCGKRNCYEFINQHYEKGNKAEAFVFPFCEDYHEFGKHVHTVSLYLMGLIVREAFEEKIRCKLSGFICDLDSWYCYKYTWFLTSLYHDIASSVEEKYAQDAKSLESFCEQNGITKYPDDQQNVLLRFDPAVRAGYYQYRKEERRNQEHGIAAGYLLFDRLYKNFDCKVGQRMQGSDVWLDQKRNLYWRKSHIDHFAYIADAIICHNIWLCTDECNEELYKKYKLDDLIVKTHQDRLSIDEDPLQFLLCLLDTIEPIKRFNNIPYMEVLQRISVSIMNSYIRVQWDDSLEKNGCFKKWLASVKTLDSWMKVIIECSEERHCVCIGIL